MQKIVNLRLPLFARSFRSFFYLSTTFSHIGTDMGKTIIFQSTTMSALKWKLCGIKHTIRLYATISYFLRSLPLFHSNIDLIILSDTAPKIKFSIKDFFGKCDQICSFLWIWPHLLKKSLMENLIFCAV